MTNRTGKKQPKNIQQSQIYANSIFVVWLLLCASLNGYQCKWCICSWSSHITFHHIFSHKIKYSRNKNVDFNISTKDLPLFFILCFFHPWCLEFSDSQMYEYCKWSTKFRMNRRTKKMKRILWTNHIVNGVHQINSISFDFYMHVTFRLDLAIRWSREFSASPGGFLPHTANAIRV